MPPKRDHYTHRITQPRKPEPEPGAEYAYTQPDSLKEGAWGVKPPEPTPGGPPPKPAEPRIGEWQVKRIRGWHPEPWDLRCALWAAARRLPRGTGLQSLLEGAERWVKLTGKGKPGPGPGSPEARAWWATAMALVDVIGRVADSGTLALLRPWLSRGTGPRPEGGAFTPFGVDGV